MTGQDDEEKLMTAAEVKEFLGAFWRPYNHEAAMAKAIRTRLELVASLRAARPQ